MLKNEIAWAAERFGVVDYVPVGIFVLRADGVVLFWNSCLEKWTGISRDDIVATEIGAHFPRLDEPQYTTRLQNIFAGGPPIFFSSQLHHHIIPSYLPNGEMRVQHTVVTAVPAMDGANFYALFSLHDVTDLTHQVRNYRAMRDRAEGLFVAARAILGATELPEICQNLVTHFNNLVKADRTTLFLVDQQRQQVLLRVGHGDIQDELQVDYAEFNTGISGMVLESGQPILSVSAYDGVEPKETRERRLRAGTGALIVVPLVARGRVIGTVTALNRIGQRRFTSHDVDLLMALATQAATTIDNVRLLAEMECQVQRWESISAINETITAQLDKEQLFELLYREALSLMGVEEEKATFFAARYDANKEELLFDLHYECGTRLPPVAIKLGRGIGSWVVQHDQALLVDDLIEQQSKYGYEVYLTPQEQATGQWARACIAVPLHVGDRVTGVISVQSVDYGVFTGDHLELLTMWSGQVAVALENARLYEEIRQFNEQLEQRIQQRTEELNRAYHNLSLLDEAKSKFINIAAHEIRTPLTVIAGYAQMLQAHPTLTDDANAQPLLANILKGVERLRAIGDSMIDMIRIDMQALDTDREHVSLATIIVQICEEFTTPLRERALSLTMTDLEQLPQVWANPNLLSKVFHHLLGNAIKYTPDGGAITITGKEVSDDDDRRAVEIIFSDTGIGIDPEHHELIFEKFYPLGDDNLHSSGATKFKGGGAALGLAICKGIVSAHAGSIWVESEGHDEENCPGSHFHVRLPVG